jgi:hypothetical protein
MDATPGTLSELLIGDGTRFQVGLGRMIALRSPGLGRGGALPDINWLAQVLNALARTFAG